MPRADFAFSTVKMATFSVAFCVGAILTFSAPPSLAADGSLSSNPDLLRGSVTPGCAASQFCANIPASSSKFVKNSPPTNAGTSRVPRNCQALEKSGVYSPECRPASPQARSVNAPAKTIAPVDISTVELEPADIPRVRVAPVEVTPIETTQPPRRVSPNRNVDRTVFTGRVRENAGWLSDDAIDATWSLSLRGGVVVNNAGTRYEATMTPNASITFLRPTGTTTLGGTTALTQSSDGSFRVGAGNVSFNLREAFNRDMAGTLGASVSLAQDDADSLSTIATQPFIATGAMNAGLTRSLGRIALDSSIRVSRQYVSETEQSDGTWTDNTYRGFWNFGATARASYELTPIVGLFGQVDADRTIFDAVSPSTGESQNAWTYQVRGGLTGAWRSGFSAEIYGGYGLRYFDSTSLAEAGDWIYGGSLTYAPQRGFTLSAALNNGISGAGTQSDATARFDHSLSMSGSYLLNDQLTARASLGATWTTFSNSTATENDYSAGIGLDYILSKNATLNGDYSVTFEDDSGAKDTTHRISAGVTFSR